MQSEGGVREYVLSFSLNKLKLAKYHANHVTLV